MEEKRVGPRVVALALVGLQEGSDWPYRRVAGEIRSWFCKDKLH